MFSRFKNINNPERIAILILGLLAALVLAAALQKATESTSSVADSVTSSTTAQLQDENLEDPTLSQSNPSNQSSVSPSLSSPLNAQCHINGVLPDANCTPGSVDDRVTQDNIQQTICVSGYTKKVRPSSSTTSAMKRVSMSQYGFTDNPSNYEYDHLISLGLGGAPSDTKNLWPEPGGIPNPKDKVENKLHSLVCSGAITLVEAQQRISTNWTTALNGY